MAQASIKHKIDPALATAAADGVIPCVGPGWPVVSDDARTTPGQDDGNAD